MSKNKVKTYIVLPYRNSKSSLGGNHATNVGINLIRTKKNGQKYIRALRIAESGICCEGGAYGFSFNAATVLSNSSVTAFK